MKRNDSEWVAGLSPVMATTTDPWLVRWLPALREAAAGTPVLELGCNTGRDTAWLAAQGFSIIGSDISQDLLKACAQAVPAARLLRYDLRKPFPFADGAFGLVLASLCLHYFDWRTSLAVVAEIRRSLRTGGMLLCRLNSLLDVNHGAQSGEEIESHYYRAYGTYSDLKRFFDRADVEHLFANGWDNVAMEEMTIDRYAKPKVLWEIVLYKL